jgi:hypothetical protein
LAYDLAQRGLKREKPDTIPLFLFMDTYDGWKDRSAEQPTPVLEFLAQYLRSHESVKQDPHGHPFVSLAANLESLLREGRLACIFDALDEMPQDRSDLRYRELKSFMSYWGQIGKGNRFIYSCRCLDYDPAFDVDEVIIDPFDRWRIRRFLERNLPLARAEGLYRRILEDESLEEIVSIPFFLQALAYINDPSHGKMWRIPATRGELIRVFVDTLLQREAQEKQAEALDRAGGREVLFRFLAYLGFILQQRREGGTSSQAGDLGELWRDHPAWKELLWIARRARILGRRGEASDDQAHSAPLKPDAPDRVEFIHHRVQEFFAADELARRLEQGDPIDNYLEDIWWQETVILAIGIVRDPRVILSKMLSHQPEVTRWTERAADQARKPIPMEAVEAVSSSSPPRD